MAIKTIFFTVLLCFISFSKANITIVAPYDLSSKLSEPISAKYSTFGDIQYGVSAYGRLYYDPDNSDACNPISSVHIEPNSTVYEQTAIFLVDRGGCSFVTKARHIQHWGGQVLMVINHQQNFADIFAIADDGTGKDIHLTAILIPEEEGEQFKNYFKDHSGSADHIILNIDNQFKNLEDKVDLKIFFNANDRKVYRFLDQIKDIIVKEDVVKFNPIYSFDLPFENGPMVQSLKQKGSCMCGTKYCDDYEIFEGGEGRKNLIESIRQKCVYNIAFNEINQKQLYFDYMDLFFQRCYESDMSKSCSDKILNELRPGLDVSVLDCFLLSFKSKEKHSMVDELMDKCDSNAYLDEHDFYLTSQIKKGLPLITIDGQFFYGSWQTDKILNAMCATLEKSPDFCAGLSNSRENLQKSSMEKIYFYSIVSIMAFIVISFMGFIIGRRYFNKKINEQILSKSVEIKIDNTVKDYLKLRLKN